jgi:hypothetical protein
MLRAGRWDKNEKTPTRLLPQKIRSHTIVSNFFTFSCTRKDHNNNKPEATLRLSNYLYRTIRIKGHELRPLQDSSVERPLYDSSVEVPALYHLEESSVIVTNKNTNPLGGRSTGG